MENKNKNLKLIALSTVALLLVTIGITWAFFSYVRTGDANVFETGDIYFNSDYTSVTLTNVFPIKKSKVDTDTQNVMTINVDITGHTTYEQGVDYKITAKNVSLQSNGKSVPISAKVTSENIPNIQTYSFEDEMVVVENSVFAQGSIMPEDGNVEGVLTIKAYIDKNNVVITDTYDGTESDEMGTTNEFVNGREVFTTEEWNNLESDYGVSFKVKVEAWEHEETLHDVMLASAVMDNTSSEFVTSSTGINFSETSSDENGKGLYMRAGTENNPYPIVYYRGDVQDNNVVFGGFCWKAVRTTETGGVKLIYNGKTNNLYEKTPLNYEDYSVQMNMISNPNGNREIVFDEEIKSWIFKLDPEDSDGALIFTIPDGDYILEFETNATSDDSIPHIMIGVQDGITYNNSLREGMILKNDSIDMGYVAKDSNSVFSVSPGYEYEENLTVTMRISKKGDFIKVENCHNEVEETIIKKDAFNSNKNSLAYSGYMYNTVYESKNMSEDYKNKYFGSGFTYENGQYKLVNPKLNIDDTHHYSCHSESSTDTCTTLRYYHDDYYYIELTNGKSVEDAINEMLYNNDVNKNDSTIKTNLETWYKNNLVNVSDKLEDTIWCNDRSVPTEGDYAFSKSGWNPNGGVLNNSLYYNGYERLENTKLPTLNCKNKTDKFNISNRIAQTNYPIGLLTSDEIVLAGATDESNNKSYYLNSLTWYWTMSPSNFDNIYSQVIIFWPAGMLGGSYVTETNTYGLRPSVSLAYGAPIEDGDGTVENPYIIGEY